MKNVDNSEATVIYTKYVDFNGEKFTFNKWGENIMNQYLKIQEKIKHNEVTYIRCFSEAFENEQIIRFRDSKMSDMKFHNSTNVKKTLSEDTLQKIIKEEIELNHKEGKDFCRITIDELPTEKCLKEYGEKLEIEHYGNYVYVSMESPKWNTLRGHSIRKIIDDSMVEDLVSLDLIQDGETFESDFCQRRARRTGQASLSEIPVDTYICYYDKIPVGSCQLFLYNGIAKIEDFTVSPEYQRRGIGTTILKYVIDIALSKKAELIYLSADEDDTAKEMYEKLGFEKVSESYALVYKL